MAENQTNQQNPEDYIFCVSSGFELLERYLCWLYEEQRRSFQNNLQRYFNVGRVCGQFIYTTPLNDILEIPEEQIRGQLVYEAWIWERANYIVKFYDEHISDGNISEEDYFAIAGELGLSVGNLAWYDTMFPQVVN